MADYWVSKNKYWCTYCDQFIADDKPSRIAHETGLKHKGNYDRKIREMYKKSERDAKDKAAEAKEIARMEAAAHAAMVADGLSVASTSRAPPPARAKSSDPYANYSTAADLGFVDKEEEKRKAEEAAKKAELEELAAAEAEQRRQEGNIGKWETVRVIKKRPAAGPTEDPKPSEEALKVEEGQGKRIEREDEIPTTRNFLKERSAVVDDDEWDPTKTAPIKLKRQRFTLREEEEQKQKEQEELRVKREVEEAEQRRQLREHRNRTTQAGWAQVDVKSEPMVSFEPETKEEENLKGEDEKPAVAGVGAKVEDEEVKPVVASSGFKKRKMHGANAARQKQ